MRIGRWIAAGVGIAAMGAAAVYAQYRQTEEPEFAVVSADADFELRDYPSLVVAEVSHAGSRERASGASFRRLAAYIFAQDRPAGGEKIAMTAPVMQLTTSPPTQTWPCASLERNTWPARPSTVPWRAL